MSFLPQRLRHEGRDLIELVLLPGLAAILPWPLCFRLFRWFSGWRWLYREDSAPALAEARRRGWVADAEAWARTRRLVTLIDHADLYLTHTRSDRWFGRYLDVDGDWCPPGQGTILCTFHWGAGMWGLRHARSMGLNVHVLVARVPEEALRRRRIRLAYIRARYRAVLHSTGRSTLDVSASLRQALGALRAGEQVMAAIDVPPELVKGSQEIPFLGQRALMPKGLLRMAADQRLPVLTYLTGVDVSSGRRTLQVRRVAPNDDLEALMTGVFGHLDEAIRRDPAAWHFWGAAGSFLRPARAAPVPAPAAPTWDAAKITDEWFRAHFHHAANTVCEWLSPHVDWKTLRLLDFGCGDGITDLALALKKAPEAITGVDIDRGFDSLPATARRQLGLGELPRRLRFVRIAAGDALAGRFDVDALISWSVFEHVERPYLDRVAADLFGLLPPGGIFFLQIDPLFHAPGGSHLGRFIRQPWAHLLMDDAALFAAVMASTEPIPPDEIEINYHARDLDGYKRFVFDEYRRLNRLTADELAALFAGHGFEILREERRAEALEPPAELLHSYPREVLQTTEIRLLMRRPVAANLTLSAPSGAA
ncbi:MAG: methyltransferase domain-containing protein [Rhodocyclaceae bacterium]|nr:methyltransferase domain-containing protein [Rhodocyclaceae bacterium]